MAGKRSNFKFGREMARIFKILSKRLDQALNRLLNHKTLFIANTTYYYYSPVTGKRASRRDFLKLMVASGVVMTFAPLVDWGKFLSNPTPSISNIGKGKLRDGSQANISTFPVNHAEVVIYPEAEHPVLNQEAFSTWQLIRLPEELAGGNNDVSAFRGCIAWYAFTSGAY